VCLIPPCLQIELTNPRFYSFWICLYNRSIPVFYSNKVTDLSFKKQYATRISQFVFRNSTWQQLQCFIIFNGWATGRTGGHICSYLIQCAQKMQTDCARNPKYKTTLILLSPWARRIKKTLCVLHELDTPEHTSVRDTGILSCPHKSEISIGITLL
jgi:hypothetical protein